VNAGEQGKILNAEIAEKAAENAEKRPEVNAEEKITPVFSAFSADFLCDLSGERLSSAAKARELSQPNCDSIRSMCEARIIREFAGG